MGAATGVDDYCTCGTPLVKKPERAFRFCVKCQVARRNGHAVTLEEVSAALAQLAEGTGTEQHRVRLPAVAADASCAVGPREFCNGAIQFAHLLSLREHSRHPLVHHPDNVALVCRYHHRLLHRIADGFELAGDARREPFPPGWQPRVSLAYLSWAVGRVRPRLLLKALRAGALLEFRLRERAETDGALEVNLYHLWLYTAVGDADGVRAFKGVLYDYDEHDYARPVPGGTGSCRTYRVYPDVVQALRAGPFVMCTDSTLRALAAHALAERGIPHKEIAKAIPTARGTTPKAPTVSGWVKVGRNLSEVASRGEGALEDGLKASPRHAPGLALGKDVLVSDDGSAVLPADLLRSLGLSPGDRVTLDLLVTKRRRARPTVTAPSLARPGGARQLRQDETRGGRRGEAAPAAASSTATRVVPETARDAQDAVESAKGKRPPPLLRVA